MSLPPQPKRPAVQAIIEAQEKILQANAAVVRARLELGGEAAHLASRLCAQLGFMSEVAELLAHEIERDDPQARLAAMPAASPSTN